MQRLKRFTYFWSGIGGAALGLTMFFVLVWFRAWTIPEVSVVLGIWAAIFLGLGAAFVLRARRDASKRVG
jgi:hypothetical protein